MAAPLPSAPFDVVVAGAGAAGLMAAIQAASRGRSTLLLEKNQRPGLKILISGGGRCNLTTTRTGADLEAQYGARRGRFLRHALRAFPPAALRAWIEAAGVPLQEEDLEKLFPVSQRARDVVDALLRVAARAGVELRLGMPVRGVERAGSDREDPGARGASSGGSGSVGDDALVGNGASTRAARPGADGDRELERDSARASPSGDGVRFVVHTPQGAVAARSVVLATGGLSYPKTGATGDGYAFSRALGHTVTETFPALAPLAVGAEWVTRLQGIVVHDVALASLDAAGGAVTARTRPILFTHQGLSGPAPMDLAGDVEEARGAGAVRFDFAPGVAADELERSWLAAAAQGGARGVDGVLPGHLPARLREALCALAGAGGASLATLGKDTRRRLLATLKDLRVPVRRSLGYDHAEVTRGGIPLDEVDPKTMQSKRCAGLYVCGELLDVDGPIGGFNFQAAFATGRLAGLHA